MRAWAAVAALAVIAGCSDRVVLAPPRDGAIDRWLLLLSDGATTEAHLFDADAPLVTERDDASVVVLEALGFDPALRQPSGPIALAPPGSSAGEALPAPTAIYRADLEAGTWTAASAPSEHALALRLPPSTECPSFTARTEPLAADDSGGVRGVLPLDEGAYLFFALDAWSRATAAETTDFPRLVPDARAATVDPSGPRYVLTSTAAWTLSRDARGTWTATLAWTYPKMDPFSAASTAPGVIHVLEDEGGLVRTSRDETTVLHRFLFGNTGHERGMIIADGDRLVAGVGPDATIVELRADGTRRMHTLPTASEGAVSLTVYRDYGLIVGTNQGILRAQSLGFEELPDPLGQMPRGIQLRALLPHPRGLFFGGNSGTLGMLLPSGTICALPVRASATVRFLVPIGDEVLIAGGTFEADRIGVNLTRIRPAP